MPTGSQLKKIAAEAGAGRNVPATRPLGPRDDLPEEYWSALLKDAAADGAPPGPQIRTLRLSEISWHVLRVSCTRCGRIVEIQKADAIRLYGRQAIWKNVGMRMLEDTCQQRTGRYEEDGCWPSYDAC